MTLPAPTASAGHGVVATAASWSRHLGVAAVAVATVVSVGTDGAPAGSLVVVVAGIGFVAGLPHGAVDHLLLGRLAGLPLAVVTVAYAATAAAAWVLIERLGLPVLGAVVLLSIVHFGLGEVEVWRRTTGWRPGPAVTVALVVAGNGALLLPLARSGDALGAVATSISPDVAAALVAGPVRLGTVAVWLAAAVTAAVAALRAGHRLVAVDLLLIGAIGLVLPPLVAVAVWFGGWHALRHGARLLEIEPGCAVLVAAGRTRAAVLRLGRLAALPGLAALAVLGGLVVYTVGAPHPAAALGATIQVLLALTVPHMLVVAWLDRSTSPAHPPGGPGG